uniref:SAFB-like transcription modulator n=1 Tax=Angiostrongylus cantonensis TaxID=6313 RepID=A0A158P8K7_ANGCA
MTDCASEQKLLSELRVTELKHELEKRNLDKNGIKIILTDRLEKALIADGHDPTTYLFRINEPVGASPKSTKQMSPTNSVDNSADIEMNTPEPAFENGNGVAKGDHNEEPVQMDSEAAQLAANSGIEKADNMGDNAKELIIADELAPAASLTTNDEEMLEDPLADVPAESTTPSAKLAVTISAQLPAKTPVQAPLPDEKENDIAARSIWVRGLTSATKAADLKVLCTQYGKVVRAKIYTSKKQSTSACYGYVTMADTAAAERAAAAMHKTQIRGRTISVEKADRSKVPAVKPTATTPMKKDASNESPAKRDSEKKLTVDGSKNKAEVVTEKSQSADARTKEKLSKSSVGRRDFSRRVVARDPRRDSQRTISAARRYPLTRGITSHTLRGRITRPGERGGYVSSIRRPEAMSQRDLLTLMRRKEEEHRRREAEIEKERALERERERIRFEREQLEKERLQLQLQAALQQQKMVAMSSSRTKDSYAPRSSSSVPNLDHLPLEWNVIALNTNQVPQLVEDEVGMILTVLRADMAHHSLQRTHPERNTREGTLRHVEGETHILVIAEMRIALLQVVLEVVLVGDRLQGQVSVRRLHGKEMEEQHFFLGSKGREEARNGGGNGGWSTFGSGGGASTSGGMRYDYDKYQQRF